MTKDELFNRTAQFISKIHDFETSLSGQGGDDQVTSLQFDLLQILYFAGPKNLSGLSQCMNINLPNCSREVRKLTEIDLIRKTDSALDKRKTELSLTADGNSKVEFFMDQMKKNFFKQNGNWDEERIIKCLKSIEVLETEVFHIE